MKGIKHSIEIMLRAKQHRVFATYNRQTFRARYVAPNTQPEPSPSAAGAVISLPNWAGAGH